jgi:hypothetical protein
MPIWRDFHPVEAKKLARRENLEGSYHILDFRRIDFVAITF